MYSYYPKGVCSRQILFNIDSEDRLKDVKFIGGCSGNLQGIAKLVYGMKVEDVIKKLKNIQCRNNTSCPDQFAIALQTYLDEKKK